MRKINKLIIATLAFFLTSCTEIPLNTTSTDEHSNTSVTTIIAPSDDSDTTDISYPSTNSDGSTTISDSTPPSSETSSTSDSSFGVTIDPSGKVTITINYNDGKTANKTVSISFGTIYGANFSFPTRTDYVFKGWFAQLSTGGEKQITADHPVEIEYNHMVKAHWEVYSGPGAPTYDFTYNFEKPDYKTGEYMTGEYIEGDKDSLYFKDTLITNSTSARDNRDGSHSSRVKKGGYIETYYRVDGLSQISFKHAPYKPINSSTQVQSTIYLEYSIDEVVWTSIETFTTSNKDTAGFSSYSKQGINIGFEIYVRLRNGTKSTDDQINIDLFRIMGRK